MIKKLGFTVATLILIGLGLQFVGVNIGTYITQVWTSLWGWISTQIGSYGG